MLKIYETKGRIEYRLRLEKENHKKRALVLDTGADSENKRKIELYLKIYEYRTNVQTISIHDISIPSLIQKIDLLGIQEILILKIEDLSMDSELLQYLLDELIRRQIRIVSILDAVVIHAEKPYLSEIEKRLFLDQAIRSEQKRSRGNSRQQIKESLSLQNNNENKRVAAYLRVSSREQTLGYSIENQKEKIMMYLELFDYTNAKVDFYIDPGRSASNLKRPQMQKMLKMVKEGEYDEVIVYKLDRLTRNVIDVYNLLQLFLAKEVNLIAILDNLDIKTANGRLLVGILAIIAQWERETIVERTNDGLMQMALEGRYPVGSCPLGYYKDDNYYLHIDPKTSSVVKSIFFYAGIGYSYTGIAIQIKNDYGMKLTDEKIKSIIFNPGYYGKYKFKDVIFEDIMPAIITEEEAKLAQRIFGRRAIYGKEQNKFIFRHRIYCKKCGAALSGVPTYKVRKRYYYYVCKKCNKRINQDVLIDKLLYPMIEKLNRDTVMSDFKIKTERIRNLNSKLKSVTIKYSEDLIDEETYTKIIHAIERKIATEKQTMSKVKIMDDISWEQMSDSAKREIVEKTIAEITVDLKSKDIDVKYL